MDASLSLFKKIVPWLLCVCKVSVLWCSGLCCPKTRDPSLENCDEITGDTPIIHVLPGVNDNLSQLTPVRSAETDVYTRFDVNNIYFTINNV